MSNSDKYEEIINEMVEFLIEVRQFADDKELDHYEYYIKDTTEALINKVNSIQ